MALADLFVDRRPKLAHIAIDLSLEETHEHSARVTDYPVEGSTDKTDHVQLLPERVSIVGRVSRTPATLGTQLRPDFDPHRHVTAWDQLVELLETRTPFVLVTSLHVYTSMILETLSAVRNFEATNTLEFQASMRRVETAFTTFAETVVAEEIKDAAEAAANTAMQGAIAADEATAAAAAGAL